MVVTARFERKIFVIFTPSFASVNDDCPLADMSILEDLQAESLSLKGDD